MNKPTRSKNTPQKTRKQLDNTYKDKTKNRLLDATNLKERIDR